ncbi:MAG: hypothetical protein FWD69_15750 [Polyangiaceae bacterium]|nr:hypothetical protein [Polyangiaceae bacterium]
MTFSNMNALCNHVKSKLAPAFKEIGNPAPDQDPCVAKPVKVPSPLPAPLKSIAWVDLIIPEGTAGTYVLETEKGFVIPRTRPRTRHMQPHRDKG